jgi:serine/threonine-protein kinase
MILADAGGPAERARFRAEAEAVAAVDHPHVVRVYESGEHGGRPFLALEYCPGGSLADRLRAGPLPPADAASLLAKVAAGVQAAHAAGVVHRDLKPANVLFAADGTPKVADFGLAKRAGGAELTRTRAVMGTPAYMAPEQAAGGTRFVGPAADVYALGAVLFECLAGRPPFESEDVTALLVKVAEEDPPSVRRFAPAVPRDLDRVCRKCLAKDPRERYASAGELAEDLDRIAAGEPPRHATAGRFGGLLGALGRGRQAAEFARFADLFRWLAVVMLLADTLMGLWLADLLPMWAGLTASYARLLAVPLLLRRYGRGRLLPQSANERFLWSVWGGYLAACVAAGVLHHLTAGWEPDRRLYQQFAFFTAVAFFALAPHHWGWFYAFGAGFLALPFVMAADIRLAPFLFGGAWAAVLVAVSRHLRALARLATTGEPRPPGSG